jgi:4-amino-4-deoxy-L-arabinose transferase-like glycosyltransferase
MISEISHTQFNIRIFKREFAVSAQWILIGIILLAILLRLVSALYLGNEVKDFPGIFDQISYDSLARRVVGGYGFTFAETHWPITRAGEPTAHWSYLYTLYLVAIYSMFGLQPIIARMVQAVIVGVLHTYIVYRIGEKLISRTIGLIAAGVTAVYIYFFYYGGALMTEPFYITAILYSLFLAMQITDATSRQQEIKLGIGLGISIAATILLRQVFLLFIPFLFAWMWIVRIRRRLGLPLLSTAISLGLVVLCIIPVSLYNQSRFGRFVLLNTNSGYAFFWGNHPIYGTHFIPILPGVGSYQKLIPEEVRHLDEAALDQELLRRGIQFVVDDPKRYVLLSLSRIPAYFMFWPSAQSGLVSNISRVASFGIMLPFMLYGLFLSIVKKPAEKGNRLLALFTLPEGLLIIFILIYSAVHLLTWALIRYRLPVDAVLIPFAAVSIEKLYQRIAATIRKSPTL